MSLYSRPLARLVHLSRHLPAQTRARALYPSLRAMSYTTHWSPGTYPVARRSSHVDEYKSAKQGTVRVADPYEWLERDTPETQTWVTDQEAYTRAFLDKNLQRSQLEDSKQICEPQSCLYHDQNAT